MTNSEAIKILQANYPDSCYGLLRDAVDTAIYALSAQSNAPNALSALDCVKRQAAIDDIKAIYEYHDTVTEDRIIDHLKRLPSVQPTLYGYRIEHLAYIAQVMEKERITAEQAVNTFDDLGRAVSWTIDEVRQKMKEVIYDHNTGKI